MNGNSALLRLEILIVHFKAALLLSTLALCYMVVLCALGEPTTSMISPNGLVSLSVDMLHIDEGMFSVWNERKSCKRDRIGWK